MSSYTAIFFVVYCLVLLLYKKQDIDQLLNSLCCTDLIENEYATRLSNVILYSDRYDKYVVVRNNRLFRIEKAFKDTMRSYAISQQRYIRARKESLMYNANIEIMEVFDRFMIQKAKVVYEKDYLLQDLDDILNFISTNQI